MEDNEYELVCTSRVIETHKARLDEDGISYSSSSHKYFGDSIIVKINTMEDLMNIIYAVEEDIIFLNDSLIEIYDSYRE